MVPAVRALKVGTVIYLRQRYAFRLEAGTHPAGEGLVLILGVQPPRNAGLIGDDNQRRTEVPRRPGKVEDAGHPFELGGLMDIALVHIDDAVTVEEKRFSGQGVITAK